MSAQQAKLVVIARQKPVPMAKGDRTHNPNQIAMAAVNKGKKYPYNSTTKAERKQLKVAKEIMKRDRGLLAGLAKEAAE